MGVFTENNYRELRSKVENIKTSGGDNTEVLNKLDNITSTLSNLDARMGKLETKLDKLDDILLNLGSIRSEIDGIIETQSKRTEDLFVIRSSIAGATDVVADVAVIKAGISNVSNDASILDQEINKVQSDTISIVTNTTGLNKVVSDTLSVTQDNYMAIGEVITSQVDVKEKIDDITVNLNNIFLDVKGIKDEVVTSE